MQQAGQQNYAYAQDVANRPLVQYQGQMVADTAPQTQQFWNTAAQAPGVSYNANNASMAGFLNAIGQTPQNVVSQSLASTRPHSVYESVHAAGYQCDNANHAAAKCAVAGSGRQCSEPAANAFGGSRQGVQQGVAQAQGAQNIGQMIANLQNQNFAQAQAAATGDISRGLQAQISNQNAAQAGVNWDILASQGLTNLGTQQNQENVANAGLQSAAGASQSMQAQNEINSQMAKFQQANQYPQTQLATLLSALGMTPHDTSTTGESDTTTTTPTDWASILTGGLNTAAGIYKMSDKKVKQNIKSLGNDPMTGVPIKSFQYKGGGPTLMGPLAQDIEKAAPGSTTKIKGIMAVPKPTLAAATPSIASSPMFAGNSPASNLSRYMPGSKSAGAATANPRAGARAGVGLAYTKRQSKVLGARQCLAKSATTLRNICGLTGDRPRRGWSEAIFPPREALLARPSASQSLNDSTQPRLVDLP